MRSVEMPAVAWRSRTVGLLAAGIAFGGPGAPATAASMEHLPGLDSDPLAFFADSNPLAPFPQAGLAEPTASTPTKPDSTVTYTGSHRANNVYYALGDSVAAGLGLPQSSGASAEDKACGRSPQAYPAIVAANLKLTLANVACSGAETADLAGRQKVDPTTTVPAQLDRAFAEGNPALITITVGANDADWSDFMVKCFTGACGTAADRKTATADLAKMSRGLSEDLRDIQAHSPRQGRTPETVVTGYYNPVSDHCGLPAGNLAWLNGEVGALNADIRQVTRRFPAFARFVPIDFAGHGACTSEPWVQPLLSSAAVHPTAQGQQVMAESVLTALHGKRP